MEIDYENLIGQWHKDRNLIDGSTDKDQYMKPIQEAGELSDSLCKGKDISDDIGDILVVLINIMVRNNLTINECLSVSASSTVTIRDLSLLGASCETSPTRIPFFILMDPDSISNSFLINLNNQSDITVLGFETPDPGRYGRLLVTNNQLLKIVEALDANDEEQKITLCNGGVMIVKADKLKENLSLLKNNNAKKEYILSDLIEIINNNGGRSLFLECDHEETIGIDSKKGLSKAEKIYQNKLRDSFMESGTTILDPETVFFSHDTKIGKDVEIGANIVFGEKVSIKDNVTIKSFCSIENSIIHDGSSIGPFARLRNNVDIGKDSKIGNFVELKNSRLEQEVKVSHLSYIGDAEIDESVNIGAGTITCNYDGVKKHKTTIGKRAFIGSNSSLIAPINIGDDANVAAGSSISKNVDSNSLAITRAPIRFISNWSKKFKKTNKEEEQCAE